VPHLRTHYDNLKVSRTAPIEVIEAAYRTLARKYHPDRNSTKDAARIMSIVNAAYQSLSDPASRQKHDDWIRQVEATGAGEAPKSQPRQETNTQKPAPGLSARTSTTQRVIQLSVLTLCVLLFLGNALLTRKAHTPGPAVTTPPASDGLMTAPKAVPEPSVVIGYSKVDPVIGSETDPQWDLKSESPSAKPRSSQFTAVREGINTFSHAPNGSPWPQASSYVLGYPRLNTDGRSSVTIDNTGNDSDVFVKLVSHDSEKLLAVRMLFIKAHDQFRLTRLQAGAYDIRYRDLRSGDIEKSKPFDLVEKISENGVHFSTVTMTLYPVVDGNTRMEPISEAEF